MGRGYAAAKARRQAAAAAAQGQGAVAEPAVAAAQPVAPAPTPETERGLLSVSPVAVRQLEAEGIRLSGEDRNAIAMDANEAMLALTGVTNGRTSIRAMTGLDPVVLRAGQSGGGAPIGVLIRTKYQAKNGINKTLVTLTPRDEYRLVHYTRRGREVSRQEGLRGDEVKQYYRDATGVALSLR